ncbi:serine/threonine protein kinase [Cognatiyoonia koreensis]|uniref:Serine/threonine protein kinase n=1 Tax=Cognatiyoonia koreensis TaxID=364200 RepID=A0A1I0RM63_9RHOB|nr:serine/threonine-protein kinase [Cognatiyoonia koreensis]SEW42236.1 serine/threonine protein kinase [Cognatiyoonia koreensis]
MGNAQLKDFDDDGEDAFVDELKPGTKLMHGQYEIEKFLNAGGFGITYLAKDSLDRKIVIKECFPGAFCRRSRAIVQARSRAHQAELKSIVRLFVQEARSLAKLDHPNIVGVHQVFEDNETAYMALDFVEGRDLLDTLEDPNHGLTPDNIKSILTDILGAVGFIHDQNILHRDISPDNILIDGDLRPVLIDFGAAREQATKQSRVLSALRVVKDGYSPQEFYIAGSEQNPSSDLYALGASFYHLIADETPPNSQARLAAVATGDADPYVPLVDKIKGYDRNFLAAIDMSLEILPKDRLQSAAEWIDAINGKTIQRRAKSTRPIANGSDTKKSKMPLLMASVAVVALFGVGVVTQTDLVPRASEAAAAIVGTDPQVLETTTAVAESPAFAPVVSPDPIVTDEPAEVAATIAPVVRPSTRPDDLAIAAPVSEETVAVTQETVSPVEEPEVVAVVEQPLPEPVITPEILRDAVSIASLPGFLANVPVPQGSPTPVLALPFAPDSVSENATAMQIEIPALVPGNEVVPEPTPAVPKFVLPAWSVDLPFTASAEAPATIGETVAGAPDWAELGATVTSVNDLPVDRIADIQEILRENVRPGDAVEITVAFGIETDGVATVHDLPIPIRHDYELLNGVGFTSNPTENGWETVVSALPVGVATDMEVGDALVAYIPNSAKIDARTTLMDILESEIAAGTTRFSFVVNRGDSKWVAGLEFKANGQED